MTTLDHHARWRGSRNACLAWLALCLLLGGASIGLRVVGLEAFGLEWQHIGWVHVGTEFSAGLIGLSNVFALVRMPGRPVVAVQAVPNQWFALNVEQKHTRQVWLSWRFRSPTVLPHGEYAMAMTLDVVCEGLASRMEVTGGWRSGTGTSGLAINATRVGGSGSRVSQASASYSSGSMTVGAYAVAFKFTSWDSRGTSLLARVAWPPGTVVRGFFHQPSFAGQFDVIVFTT